MPKKLSDEPLGSPVPTYTTSLLGSADAVLNLEF